MKSRTLLLLACVCAPIAADWPQWRGADRTDVSGETGLVAAFRRGSPPLFWTNKDAGLGYAGPAVVGDRLFTMGAFGQEERVYALDVHTGKQRWQAPIGPLLTNHWGDGPRGTPTVDGDLLYALGGQGNLVCVETATGKPRWRVSLPDDLGGTLPNWGYTESPLVDGDRLVCTPGGARGTLAALDKKTGKVLWRSKGLTDGAAYSSAVVAEVGGVRHYVQMTPQGVVGVAADDGRLLWRSEIGANSTAVIPTPIFHDNCVLVTSGYGSGCGLVKLTPDGQGGVAASQLYANKNMVNQHGGVVRVGEHLYGYSDNGGWECLNFKTGDVVWSERRKLGKGSLTCADAHLFCYNQDDGTLAVIAASPAGWKEVGRFKIPQESSRRSPSGGVWTHPVVANGRLYLRDQELLFCYNLKPE
jgi:outer membrane protein assembly factor BamB